MEINCQEEKKEGSQREIVDQKTQFLSASLFCKEKAPTPVCRLSVYWILEM